ncbi:MAG: ABC transporter permease [Acidobacteria bacterium]|nr:ABC transporter permease [Acidobacteriota bacterium]
MKMSPWRRWSRWRKRDSEIRLEIEAHLAMLKHDLIERGATPERAELEAQREFGNRTLIAEVTREMWGWTWFERFGRNLLFGLRSLWKSPGFVAAAILIMVLGVGANTAVFSVVHELLIRPLPYRDADSIVEVAAAYKPRNELLLVSAADFQDYVSQNTTFAAMALYGKSPVPTRAGAVSEYADATMVSPQFFDVFQLRAARGRLFRIEDFPSSSFRAGVAVISDSYWRSRCGADPNILGRTLHVSSAPLTVIGVLPGQFSYPDKTEIWIPMNASVYGMSRGARNFRAVGRLKPKISIEAAQAQMSMIAAEVGKRFPTENRGIDVVLTPLRDHLVGDVRPSLLILFGAVGTILLIACVNLAGIVLVRTTARSQEMSMRLALGASRAHLWLQLMAESIVLAVPVTILSLLTAYAARRILLALASSEIRELGDLPLDGPILAFCIGLSILTIMLFSCVPAWHACRLNQSGGRIIGSAGTGRLRALLVVGEIALSVVLLAAGGLLAKSFYRLQSVDLGFRPENVLVMTASYPSGRWEDSIEATRFFSRLRAEVAALPGVTAVGAIRSLPGDDAWSYGGHVVNHRPRPGTTTPEMTRKTAYVEVAPGTFQTLGVPLIRGRDFADSDAYHGPSVAIINEELARLSYPNQDPVGRTIFCGLNERSFQGMRIVGVVGNIHQYGPAGPALPAIYMPHTQHPSFTTRMNLVVQSAREPAALVEAMRRKAHELSPDVPVRFTTLEAVLRENTATARVSAFLVGLLAALALCLAVVGIYGVMAYLVAQRHREIGVRIALGAGIGKVFSLVLREGGRLTLLGLVLGLLGAGGAARVLVSLLFEVQPHDPSVYAGISLLVVVVTFAAISLPAWRATRVDPMTALRLE